MKYPKVLQKILEQKWSEIAKIPDLSNEFPFPTFSLRNFLLSEKGSIIAECKKASPSKGVIRRHYNPVKIALEYQNSGAKAISVLTDKEFFMGSLEDLKNVSQNVALPVLRKDFLLHEKQILEARHYGASAVLLIVRILELKELKALYEFARKLNLDVLVEVHTKEEAQKAVDIGAEIIGINTRDLDTLEIKPELIPEISQTLPNNVVIVGESGIQNRDDYLNMLPYVQSVLIGTYFMESENISEAFRNLLIKK